MAYKLFNYKTHSFSVAPGSDANGPFIEFENGTKEYYLTTAITGNVTTTTAAANSFAKTSHATGRGKFFKSDGSKWQNLGVAVTPGATVNHLTENSGVIGGTNNGDLPNLTATYTARTGSLGGTANGAWEDEGTLSTSDTYTDAAVNTVVGKLKNNIAELATVVAQLAADNIALRAADRENAAKINELIIALEGNSILNN